MPAAIGTGSSVAYFESWSTPGKSLRAISVTAGQGQLLAMHAQTTLTPTISDSQGNTWYALPGLASGLADGGAANTKLLLFYCPAVATTGTLNVTADWGGSTAPQGVWGFAPITGHNTAAGSGGVQLVATNAVNTGATSISMTGSVSFADSILLAVLGINSNNADRSPTVPSGFTRIATGWTATAPTQLDWSKKSLTASGSQTAAPGMATGHSGVSSVLLAVQSAPTTTTLTIPLHADWIGATGLLVDYWAGTPGASAATRITSGLSALSDGAGGASITITGTSLAAGSSPQCMVQGTPVAGSFIGQLCGTATYVTGSVGAVSGDPVSFFTTGFESPVALSAASGNDNTDQYLSGSPFPFGRWAGLSAWDSYVLGVVGTGNPTAATNYVECLLKTVTSRANTSTKALSLSIKGPAPALNVSGHVEQACWQQYQSPGLPGTQSAGEAVRVEPVWYQRWYVKFDPKVLARAQRIGSSNFYQIFWEMKAEPDYRMRLQLLYNGSSLYWHTQGDVLTNATALWQASLTSVPVTLAAQSSQSGWHKVEVWVDRPNGRFKAAINGTVLIDRTGTLLGSSGNVINQAKVAMCYSDIATSTPAIWSNSEGPIETLYDDMEFFPSPPANAWT